MFAFANTCLSTSKHPARPQTLKTAKVQVLNISTQNLKGKKKQHQGRWMRVMQAPVTYCVCVGVCLEPSWLSQVELNYWFQTQIQMYNAEKKPVNLWFDNELSLFYVHKKLKISKAGSNLKKTIQVWSRLSSNTEVSGSVKTDIFVLLTCCWYTLLALWSRSWPAGRFPSQISDYLD